MDFPNFTRQVLNFENLHKVSANVLLGAVYFSQCYQNGPSCKVAIRLKAPK